MVTDGHALDSTIPDRVHHLEYRVSAIETAQKAQQQRIERLIASNERMTGAVKVVGFLLTLASVVIQLVR